MNTILTPSKRNTVLTALGRFFCWNVKLPEICRSKCAQDFQRAIQEKQSTIITLEPDWITRMEDFESVLVEKENTMPISNTNTVGAAHTGHSQIGNVPNPLITGDNNTVTLFSQLNQTTHPETITINIQDSSDVFTNCMREPKTHKAIEQTAGEDEITGIKSTDSSNNAETINIRRNGRSPKDMEQADFNGGGPMILPDECILGFSSGQIQAGNLTNSVIQGNNNTVSINKPQSRPTSLTRNKCNHRGYGSTIIIIESGPEKRIDAEQVITEEVPAVTKTRYIETETIKHGLKRNASLEDIGYVSAEGQIEAENTINAVTTGNNNGLKVISPKNPPSLGKHQDFKNQKHLGPFSGRGSSEELVLVPIILKLSFSSEQSGTIVICGMISYRKSQAVRDYIESLKDSMFPTQCINAETLPVRRICFVQIAGSQTLLVFDKRECFMSADFTKQLNQMILQAHTTGWVSKALIVHIANRIWQNFELWKDAVPDEFQSLLFNLFEFEDGSQKVNSHMEESRTREATNYISQMTSWILQTCSTAGQ